MKNRQKKAKKGVFTFLTNNFIFFLLLFILLLVLFRNAFTIKFFSDDYFFLKISKVKSIKDFINFFSPLRQYSFKPLSQELFYSIIIALNYNTFIGHVIVFFTYFIGLYFLFKTIVLLTKDSFLAKICVFIFSISFTHVFQLYYLATYQEVNIFTYLTISFFLFLKERYGKSIVFYIFALLSKETATLYILFLLIITVWKKKYHEKKFIRNFIKYAVVTLFFVFLYQLSLRYVTSLDNYKIELNFKRIINNCLWYFLWGAGFPNFLPDYITSIFFKPIPAFWGFFNSFDFRMYFFIYLSYLSLFILSLLIYVVYSVKEVKKILLLGILSLVCFFIFLGPQLSFLHRWMVRLMLPLIFLSIFQGYILVKYLRRNIFLKTIAIILITLYCAWNYYGIKVHESSSSYLFENRIYYNTKAYFAKNHNKILKKNSIYIKNTSGDWGSVKLKTSYHDQDFLDYFFPGIKIKAIYEQDSKKIPSDSFIATNSAFLR